jgi:hypothetical protein
LGWIPKGSKSGPTNPLSGAVNNYLSIVEIYKSEIPSGTVFLLGKTGRNPDLYVQKDIRNMCFGTLIVDLQKNNVIHASFRPVYGL